MDELRNRLEHIHRNLQLQTALSSDQIQFLVSQAGEILEVFKQELSNFNFQFPLFMIGLIKSSFKLIESSNFFFFAPLIELHFRLNKFLLQRVFTRNFYEQCPDQQSKTYQLVRFLNDDFFVKQGRIKRVFAPWI